MGGVDSGSLMRLLSWPALSFRGFERRVEHFHVALLAQVLEPVVEEHVHLPLEQNLFNARGHLSSGGIASPGAYWGSSVSR